MMKLSKPSFYISEVRRVNRPPFDRNNRKRSDVGPRAVELPIKQYRNETNQRIRCARCFQFSHRNRQCPALSRTCNGCGKRGHFVAACRRKQVNFTHHERNDKPMDKAAYPGDDSPEDNKQVVTDKLINKNT